MKRSHALGLEPLYGPLKQPSEEVANHNLYNTIDKKSNASRNSGGITFSVRTKGLEPPRRKTLDPKSSAATNYATCAFAITKLQNFF